MGPPYLPGSPPSALWESPVSFLPSPGRPFPAPLPFFPVRRLRALSAPSPERGSRPPRAAPDLCPDRLRQSGFSIFHRPFAIPPSWFSGMKKGLDLSCQAPVVGLPPFPAPMKKPPFVVKERFFSRLAVHYFVFYMYPFVHCCKPGSRKHNRSNPTRNPFPVRPNMV